MSTWASGVPDRLNGLRGMASIPLHLELPGGCGDAELTLEEEAREHTHVEALLLDVCPYAEAQPLARPHFILRGNPGQLVWSPFRADTRTIADDDAPSDGGRHELGGGRREKGWEPPETRSCRGARLPVASGLVPRGGRAGPVGPLTSLLGLFGDCVA